MSCIAFVVCCCEQKQCTRFAAVSSAPCLLRATAAVLEVMRQERVQPVTRTFNTIMIACNTSGQWQVGGVAVWYLAARLRRPHGTDLSFLSQPAALAALSIGTTDDLVFWVGLLTRAGGAARA